MEDKEIRIKKIIAKIKGFEFCTSIPVAFWITNPGEVAHRLNEAGKMMGLSKRFTAKEIGRKHEK
ncbi:MAG: hypothetical protein A2066_14970 [Bacteroidetes bacterium GWB2_41_8]|nr:MAG: hypothetical protein A2066_14970 [Bacteroidetes bacterium GWB2_41_8]